MLKKMMDNKGPLSSEVRKIIGFNVEAPLRTFEQLMSFHTQMADVVFGGNFNIKDSARAFNDATQKILADRMKDFVQPQITALGADQAAIVAELTNNGMAPAEAAHRETHGDWHTGNVADANKVAGRFAKEPFTGFQDKYLVNTLVAGAKFNLDNGKAAVAAAAGAPAVNAVEPQSITYTLKVQDHLQADGATANVHASNCIDADVTAANPMGVPAWFKTPAGTDVASRAQFSDGCHTLHRGIQAALIVTACQKTHSVNAGETEACAGNDVNPAHRNSHSARLSVPLTNA